MRPTTKLSDVRQFAPKVKRREQFQPGTVYSELDLRKLALEVLRRKNRELHGKRGSGHVGLTEWSIRIVQLSSGSDRTRIVAKGYRHKTFEPLQGSELL